MPVLLGPSSRVICQSSPDEKAQSIVHQCLAYGTDVVAWVQAGLGGQESLGLPIFDTVGEATKQTGAQVSLVLDPPARAGDSVLEAEESGISLVVCCTSDVPHRDLVEVTRLLARNGRCRFLGPGSCGVLSVGQSKVGLMPGYIFTPGPVGVVSCDDTSAYEAVWRLSGVSVGQSTFVGIGSGPTLGMSMADVVEEFTKDSGTEAIFMVAESGDAAIEAASATAKPVAIYIPGQTLLAPAKFVPKHVQLIASLAQVGPWGCGIKKNCSLEATTPRGSTPFVVWGSKRASTRGGARPDLGA